MQGGGSRTPATDIICPMYARLPQLAALAALHDQNLESRPVILCEYAHSMGNSTGNLALYWQAFEAHPALQGGFIWDWKDQCLTKRTTLTDGTQVRWVGWGDRLPSFAFVCGGTVLLRCPGIKGMLLHASRHKPSLVGLKLACITFERPVLPLGSPNRALRRHVQ